MPPTSCRATGGERAAHAQAQPSVKMQWAAQDSVCDQIGGSATEGAGAVRRVWAVRAPAEEVGDAQHEDERLPAVELRREGELRHRAQLREPRAQRHVVVALGRVGGPAVRERLEKMLKNERAWQWGSTGHKI
eukprot:2408170-Prymnesium_polylepis.1